MRIRKFYLENAAGERMPLNGENNIFLSEPSGLGLTLTPSYADLKRGFFRAVSDDAEPQSGFAGTLTFYGANPYLQWQNFVDWCAMGGQLLLVYSPFNGSEFYRQADISYFSKGEKNAVGALDVPMSLNFVTPWYKQTPTRLDLFNSGGSAIRYTYRYTDDLIYGADASANLTATISPGGHKPGSVFLRYTGAISNPRIRLVGDVSGKTYGLASLEASISDGDTLEFSTLYRDSHVYRVAANGNITDLEDSLSVASEPYFHFPIDEPSTLSIEADTVFSGSAVLQAYYYYGSV